MKNQSKASLVALALAIASGSLMPGVAHGAISVTIEQQGSDVVVSYSGSIDTTGIGFNIAGSASINRIVPTAGQVLFQNNAATYVSLVDFGKNPWTVPPSAFGTGGLRNFDSLSVTAGNAFGFQSSGFFLEPGYASGSTISGSATFQNESLATLGIDVGTMTATFSSGDTLTVTAVPEPTSALIVGLVGLGVIALRHRKKR